MSKGDDETGPATLSPDDAIAVTVDDGLDVADVIERADEREGQP